MAPKGCHLLRPDSRVIDRDGWYQVITPSDPTPSSNEVLFSEIDHRVDDVIDETIAQYREHDVAFKWCVGPWTRPDDLGERLSKRGFIHWYARGMVCATGLRLGMPTGSSIEEVSVDSLDLFLDTAARGWELPPESTPFKRDTFASKIADGTLQLFIARCHGEPAGTAGTFIKDDGSGYLVGANVLATHRGRGIYRALLEGRMAALRELGIDLATTQAREHTSAPMLEHLGFETVFRMTLYQWNPRA